MPGLDPDIHPKKNPHRDCHWFTRDGRRVKPGDEG
jgi:hypothetical protein